MKLKFKGISTKYMLIFMALIVVTVVILSIMITTIISNFSLDIKLEELSNSNVVFLSYFNTVPKGEEAVEMLKDNQEKLDEILEITFLTNPNCHIMTTDEMGNLTMYARLNGATNTPEITYDFENGLPAVIRKNAISMDYIDEIAEERDTSMNSSCDGFFNGAVALFASVLTDEDGNLKGTVISFTYSGTRGDVIREMMRAIIITIVWISAVALVAIYGVSYSVMRPLREIGNAAKSFSRGKFDVRVPVRGNDELSELAMSFNKMASALQTKDEAQKTFLSNVSHDLRTPMTTIAGFIDGIIDGAIPADKQEYYLNIIKNEIKRLSRLVTSLLDISRLQSGDRTFDMRSFNVCEMARQTIISFETQLEIKELDVELDFEELDTYVIADKDAINQVVYNLCHNAIKFSYEKGKYRVSIKETDDGRVRFSMYNEGVGISKEEMSRVFDRFFKSDKSRGLDKTGVGLGLFISKTIIEAHGEELGVRSEYGKYCEFSFTLKRDTSKDTSR